jgi:hypothetical protein
MAELYWPYAAAMSDLTDFETELRRVVDRLRAMPVRHLPTAAEHAYRTCEQLLVIMGETRPLPRLADHAAGDQLAVIASECRTINEAAVAEATAALVALRRAL